MKNPDPGSIDQNDYYYIDEVIPRPRNRSRHFFKVEIKAARRTAKDELKKSKEFGSQSINSQERKQIPDPSEFAEYIASDGGKKWNHSQLLIDRKRKSSITEDAH